MTNVREARNDRFLKKAINILKRTQCSQCNLNLMTRGTLAYKRKEQLEIITRGLIRKETEQHRRDLKNIKRGSQNISGLTVLSFVS